MRIAVPYASGDLWLVVLLWGRAGLRDAGTYVDPHLPFGVVRGGYMATNSHSRYSAHPWTDGTWCAEFDDHAPYPKNFRKTAVTRVRRPLFLWIYLQVLFSYPIRWLMYYCTTVVLVPGTSIYRSYIGYRSLRRWLVMVCAVLYVGPYFRVHSRVLYS